jgi:hypothetical protein
MMSRFRSLQYTVVSTRYCFDGSGEEEVQIIHAIIRLIREFREIPNCFIILVREQANETHCLVTWTSWRRRFHSSVRIEIFCGRGVELEWG